MSSFLFIILLCIVGRVMDNGKYSGDMTGSFD